MSQIQLAATEIAAATERRLSYQGLLAIEGNALTADEIAMFEMFDREGWSHERCRQYILDRLTDDRQPGSG